MTSTELLNRQRELSAAVYAAEQDRDEDGYPNPHRIEAAENALKDFEAQYPEIHALLAQRSA